MDRLVGPALRAIVDAIEGIETAMQGKTFEDFEKDWLLRHGTQRGIEIISEASPRVPADIQSAQAHIPWLEVMGIGNVLLHEYHRISDKVIWNVVQRHLSSLKTAVMAIQSTLNDEQAQ